MAKYVLSVDQSTQGTKALLFNEQGDLIGRADRAHRQITNELGWVEHDPEEIWRNTLNVIRDVTEGSGIDKAELSVMGISNQRETTVCWNRKTGEPVCNAIVWQCARAAGICEELAKADGANRIFSKTGIPLSPYFRAAKLAWLFRNSESKKMSMQAKHGEICAGTIDSWLIYKLTGGQRFQTDYSNASRTQLMNLKTLTWDPELLAFFGIARQCLPTITDSDGDFGETDLDGWLDHPIPIRGVLGDSHGALLGQGCREPGMIKATYGTGSSIMMNIGEKPIWSDQGLVTSLAWKLRGKVSYVLEGNINYTGAVITWLKDDLKLIVSPGETEALARAAVEGDTTYLVPAFSGLGAPYWDSRARACLCGMTRTTGRNEVVRAALDCIAYQITDIVEAMRKSAKLTIGELRADGGPTRNAYLMELQSDLLRIPVRVPDQEELSGIGAAYAAGMAVGLYGEKIFERLHRSTYEPKMAEEKREAKLAGWHEAVRMVTHA